jgi:RHS repeat-associated protein
LQQNYDGDMRRAKKVDSGTTTYYLRSSVLGGQVVAEISTSGTLQRGYVYLGGDVIAVQQSSAVSWMHQDPIVKSKRVTNGSGTVVSTIELDPWGGNTSRNNNAAFQPRSFTTYIRDSIAADDAMFRRYNRWWSRFDQPDPYNGSYNLANPQSFNRYPYAQNDPANRTDPSGLLPCGAEFGSNVCMGSGFWGGGVNMNNHVSLLGGSGRQTINEAEYDHDYRYDPENGPFRFRTAFTGTNWLGWDPKAPTGECARFANRVQQIAANHSDVGSFVDELAQVFIGLSSSDSIEMGWNGNNSAGETFTSSGFRSDLFDSINDNQARHFMGGLIAGYRLGGAIGAGVMNHNEDSQADLRMNEVSIPLGASLTSPVKEQIVDRGDRGGWRKIKADPGFKTLPNAIRERVCAK